MSPEAVSAAGGESVPDPAEKQQATGAAQPLVSVRGLGKCYEVFARPEHRLAQLFLGRRRRLYREFWALRGIDLEVARGETVGIVGCNGSGKSTLLQLVCSNLEPSCGDVVVRGRVAALLELGAGFNPEFTGRENVFLSATIMGVDEAQMSRRLAEVEAFADIGEHIDQPVKVYSSGMYARLAFAVAIHVEPDLLVVDEALSVGDEAFQRKCYARIEAIRHAGGSILFVSHSAAAIVDLCDRAVLLHHGERLYTGEPKRAVGLYQSLIYASPAQQAAIRDRIVAEDRGGASPVLAGAAGGPDDAPAASAHSQAGVRAELDPALVSKSRVVYPPNGASIEEPRLLAADGRHVNCLVGGERYRLEYEVEFYAPAPNVRFYSTLKTVSGTELGGGVHPPLDDAAGVIAAPGRVRVGFSFDCRLNPGTYFFNCGVGGHEGQVLHRILDALPFRVVARRTLASFGAVDFGFRTAHEAVAVPGPAGAAQGARRG